MNNEAKAAELPLEGMPYNDLQEVLDYWNAKRGSRFAPARADIEPLVLTAALPRILLAEVLSDPFDFRCRLM